MGQITTYIALTLLAGLQAFADESAPQLEKRRFRVGSSLDDSIRHFRNTKLSHSTTGELEFASDYYRLEESTLKGFFSEWAGASWPTGSKAAYINTLSLLLVTNTPENLGKIGALLADSNCTPLQYEVELQFVAFENEAVEALIQKNEVSAEKLLDLWKRGKGSLLCAPKLVTTSADSAKASVLATFPASGKDKQAVALSSAIDWGPETDCLSVKVTSSIFSVTLHLEPSTRVLAGGGFSLGDTRSVVYVFATVWIQDSNGERHKPQRDRLIERQGTATPAQSTTP